WDELLATPIRETAGGMSPAISSDGERLAFLQSGQIRVLSLDGGPVLTLAEGAWPRWGPDSYVYLEQTGVGSARVPGTGGPVEPLTALGEGEAAHIISDVLPGGDGALVMVVLDGGASFEVRGLDLASGEMRSLVFGQWPRYAETGHLLYTADGTLMAAPFDARRLEVTGPAVAMVASVGNFAVSRTGKLFYTSGGGGGAVQRQLVWVTRSGQVTPIDPSWTYDRGDANQGWTLSPDGRRLALRERTESGYDIWVKQLDQGPRSRLTLDEAHDRKPIWGPDARTISFLSDRDGDLDVWAQPADGTGQPRLVFDFERTLAEFVWSPDGEWLVVRSGGVGGVEGGRDIYAVRPGTDSVATALVATEFDEVGPNLSPDGRWLVYTSAETGRYEVYVRPFPDVDAGRWQVSVQGGFSPNWTPDGRQIVFMDANRTMVAVDVRTGSDFEYGTPQPLFTLANDIEASDLSLQYAIAPDGRFVMTRTNVDSSSSDAPSGVILVNNFFEELRARAGG
ncbi:MAG TPA: hypothetical protein VLA09_01920, partial [Longimicrobiales bacterium]|nr:hypothetical protein [Longimicrobiales bacterium]